MQTNFQSQSESELCSVCFYFYVANYIHNTDLHHEIKP